MNRNSQSARNKTKRFKNENWKKKNDRDEAKMRKKETHISNS